MQKPQGVLGVKWGEDAAAAARQLGVACDAWSRWEGGEPYEVCLSSGANLPAFGETANVQLVRRGTALVGARLLFRDCASRWAALRDTIRSEYDLEPSDDEPYARWRSGEVVRLSRDARDGTCTLTLADSHFGEAYAAFLLKQGAAGVGASMRPR